MLVPSGPLAFIAKRILSTVDERAIEMSMME